MTGWLIFIGFGVFILILRNDQKIEAWWRNGKARATGTTMDKHSQELYEQEWSRGKQVTFMEPDTPASPVVKVDSKPVVSSITSLYESMTPRDQMRFKAGLPLYLLEQLRHYENSKALDERQYRYP